MGLKHLKAGVEKKFPIPLRSLASTEYGRIRDFAVSGAQTLNCGPDAIDGELVRSGGVYDASLAPLFPARFKLRLDQYYRLDDERFAGATGLLLHRTEHRGQHQRGR